MNAKIGVVLGIVALLLLVSLIPMSHASSISVALNPNNNEATIDAFINTSLEISASSSAPIGQGIIDNISSSSTSGNLTIENYYMGSSSSAFQALNNSITQKNSNVSLVNLSLGFKRLSNILVSGSTAKLFDNSSLEITMVISGIFQNNSANLSWRSFSTNQNVSLNGTNVNKVNFGDGIFTGTNSVNTVNLSAFSKSLVEWNRTYNPTSNTTIFSTNAGLIADIQDSGSYYGTSVNLSFSIDPSYTISAPGYDTATSDSVILGSPPATNPIGYYLVGAILMIGLVAMMYKRRRSYR